MERSVFGVLILSGLCHLTCSRYLRQYNYISEPKNWTEAQQYCREKYADLATVNNVLDLEELAGLITSQVKYTFLGLYRGWFWSLSDTDDYKEGELAYWNWASGEPAEKYCGTIRSTGEWFATDCNCSLNFFCYDASTTDISQRFVSGNGSMDWFAAQTYCRKWHTDLARVQNQLENEELQRKVSSDSVWIGLIKNSWMWSDGSEPSFTPWKPDEPMLGGPDCAALDANTDHPEMTERSCTEKLPFFCYSAPQKKRWVRLKLTADDSSIDMTDPAVMESILKWVEGKLSDEGASEGVKLSFTKLPEKERNSTQEQTKTFEIECVP